MEARRSILLELLKSVHVAINDWEVAQSIILAQLQSLRNLSSQLQALENCYSSSSAGGLGALGKFPTSVISRLRGKIVHSRERANDHVLKDKKTRYDIVQKASHRHVDKSQMLSQKILWMKAIEEVVKKLGRKQKKASMLLKQIIDINKDILPAAEHTPQHFSLVECFSWVQDLSVAYQTDCQEKMASLETMEYTNTSLNYVVRVWEKRPAGINDIKDKLRFTIM